MSSSKPLVPLWAQISIGATILVFIGLIVARTSFNASEWTALDSNFYMNTNDALVQARLNVYQGPVPTLVIFWENSCKPCKENIKFLRRHRNELRIIGVHSSTDQDKKIEARKWWLKNLSRQEPLYFDDNEMLKYTFEARVLPLTYIIFPLKKKIIVHSGMLKTAKPSLIQVISQD